MRFGRLVGCRLPPGSTPLTTSRSATAAAAYHFGDRRCHDIQGQFRDFANRIGAYLRWRQSSGTRITSLYMASHLRGTELYLQLRPESDKNIRLGCIAVSADLLVPLVRILHLERKRMRLDLDQLISHVTQSVELRRGRRLMCESSSESDLTRARSGSVTQCGTNLSSS